MDPFSGVTALVPIAVMLLKAGCELKVFVRELRTAPEDAHHFMNDMISYSNLFQNLQRTIQESGYNLDPDDMIEEQDLVEHVVEQATRVMKGFKEDFSPIIKLVRDEADLGAASLGTRLKWYMKKSKVTSLRRSIEEAKSNAQLLLSLLNHNINRKNGLVLQTFLKPNQVPRQL